MVLRVLISLLDTSLHWVLHEIWAHDAYRATYAEIHCWRLASGIEVDFVLGDMAVAIEAKASSRITDAHLRGLRQLANDHPRTRRVVVCLKPKRRRTGDGIEILPVRAFLAELGALLGGY